MTLFQLLWRVNGEYILSGFGQRVPGGIYLGSLRQLAKRYSDGGRDWFLSRLPGLPPAILAAVEAHTAAKQRIIAEAAADIAASRAEQEVWGEPAK